MYERAAADAPAGVGCVPEVHGTGTSYNSRRPRLSRLLLRLQQATRLTYGRLASSARPALSRLLGTGPTFRERIMSLNKLREQANRVLAKLERAKERVAEEESAFETVVVRYGHESQAQEVVQQVAQQVQQQAHDRIASVVSHCLSAVFAEPHTFTIRFERKRGRTEAILTFLKGQNEVSPGFGSAGGELDVAAFALRIACLSLTQPPLRKVLILDEPARALHGDENRARFRELIETLPRELGVQIIFVTGLDWLQCGKVVRL